MARPKGWRREPARHSLAARGIRTVGKKAKSVRPTKTWPDAKTFSGKRYGFHLAFNRWVDAVREEERLRKTGIAARAVQRQTPLLDQYDKRRYGRFAVYRLA